MSCLSHWVVLNVFARHGHLFRSFYDHSKKAHLPPPLITRLSINVSTLHFEQVETRVAVRWLDKRYLLVIKIALYETASQIQRPMDMKYTPLSVL
jgi:hypothetical protein